MTDDEEPGNDCDVVVPELLVCGTVVAVVDCIRDDSEATSPVRDVGKYAVGTDKVLSFDGSCPRMGLIKADGSAASPPVSTDDGIGGCIVAD